MNRDTLQKALDKHELTVSAEFVPISDSENAKERYVIPADLCLNWDVTLFHRGHKVFTTPYTAGIWYCSSYPYKNPEGGNYRPEDLAAVLDECMGRRPTMALDSLAVFCCLIQETAVLDHGGFAEWAAYCGGTLDSEKAKQRYLRLLRNAVVFRASVGADSLNELRDATRSVR